MTAFVTVALSLVATSPSIAIESRASGSVQLVVERIRNQGPASFRLDISVEPGEQVAFVGSVATRLDPQGRPVVVHPGIMSSLNEHREPTFYAGHTVVSTCSAGQCGVGRTPIASYTAGANDPGPSDTPIFVIAVQARTVRWSFKANGYRLRRVRPTFTYVTGRDSTSVGLGFVGMGAEAYVGDAALPGGPGGSLAAGTAPCSTTGSGLVSRGAGRVTLTGGRTAVVKTCPIDNGRLAAGASARTTWRLQGPVVGDQEFRGARLLVIDLPLR